LEKKQNDKKIERDASEIDEEEVKAVNKKILNTILASDDLADYVPEYEEIDEVELYKVHSPNSNILTADTTAEEEDLEEEDDGLEVAGDGEYEDDEEVFGETDDNKSTFAKIPKNDPAAYWLRPALFAKKDEHDCQTIVSTYSNTDNHPSVIASVAGKSRTAVTKIKLSNKTGLPILEKEVGTASPICEENESEEEGDDGDIVREITLAPTYRPKDETAEQKKERKAAVKAQRKEKRELKKDLKSSYKYETAKAKVTDSVAVDITARRGQAVFKY
jgi:hypothetical protein